MGNKNSKVEWGWVAKIDKKKVVIPDDLPDIFVWRPSKEYPNKRVGKQNAARKYLNDPGQVTAEQRARIEDWLVSNGYESKCSIWKPETHPNPPRRPRQAESQPSQITQGARGQGQPERSTILQNRRMLRDLAYLETVVGVTSDEYLSQRRQVRRHLEESIFNQTQAREDMDQRVRQAMSTAFPPRMIFSEADLRQQPTSPPGSQMQHAIEASLRTAPPPTHEQDQLQRTMEASLNEPQPTTQPGATLPTESVDGDGSCIVCFEGTAEYVVALCGHAHMCLGCAGKVDACPTCRAPRTMTMRIFALERDSDPGSKSECDSDSKSDPDPEPKKKHKSKRKKKRPSWKDIPKDEFTPEQLAEYKAEKRRKLNKLREELGDEEYFRRVREHNAKRRRDKVIKPRAEWAK